MSSSRVSSPPKRGVAGDECGDRVGGEDTQEEPRGGPGIAEIEEIFRLDKPPDPDAVHRPSSITGREGMRAERIDRCGRRQHVLTLE